ncbi:MAG TPA: CehA/McbA family metallohydrolase [Vicinamibacteria bacterium]
MREANAVLLLAATILVACGSPSVPSGATSSTTTPVCGNGVVESGEECDDGNAQNADRCLTTCHAPANWVPSDVHVHSTGCGRYTSPDQLAARLKAQGLQVGAALVWGEGFHDDAPLFTGRDHPASDPGVLLHYDLEVSHFAAAKTGHLLLLGLDSLGFSEDVFSRPSTGVPVIDWARRQPRAVVGMAHGHYWPADGSFPEPPGGCCVPWEVVVNAARGRLDFLSMEIVPGGQGPVDAGTFRLWKALQNTGFRVAIAGGSDLGCLTHVFGDDTPRTDVIVDGSLTYERWLEGIKAGRTAAASGAGVRLNLRVDGRRLGEELLLSAPQEVGITLETQGPATDVAILVNGVVAHRVPVAAGAQVVQARVPVSRSSWVAARSPRVLTSPVYVLVGGQPIRASADDTCYLWRSVEDLTDLVKTGWLRLTDSRDEALRAYDEAVVELQRRFVESGGQACR